ncbi:MAG: DedA family protein [Desulfobulbaceae bacterium]|nr:DedA family protein [Desulfobulbaceae bacterium]
MAGNTQTSPDPKPQSLLHRIYLKCMEWIATPAGVWALFFIAIAESSFFPIPPDVFLIALCINNPKKSFKYAAICSAGSVIGGAIGYGLGWSFMDTAGKYILDLYGLHDKYAIIQGYYQEYDVLTVFAAGFTPLPYKLFTITAGVCKLNFFTFILISLISRSARFFLVSGLIYRYGSKVSTFINRYFNLLSIAFMILLIGGFVLFKIILH